MIPPSVAAATDLDDLIRHYAALGRDQAIEKLATCLATACQRDENGRAASLRAPRPYPGLADLGFRRVKEGPYWVAFGGTDSEPVVVAVFHETADIAGRL